MRAEAIHSHSIWGPQVSMSTMWDTKGKEHWFILQEWCKLFCFCPPYLLAFEMLNSFYILGLYWLSMGPTDWHTIFFIFMLCNTYWSNISGGESRSSKRSSHGKYIIKYCNILAVAAVLFGYALQAIKMQSMKIWRFESLEINCIPVSFGKRKKMEKHFKGNSEYPLYKHAINSQ